MAQPKNDPNPNSSLDNKTLMENIKGLETEKNMLKEQKERAEKKIEEVSQELQQKDEDIQSLQQNVNNLQQQIEQLTNEKNDLADKYEELSQREPQNQTDHAAIEQLTQERDKARHEASEAATSRDNIQQQYNALAEKYNALKSEEKGIILSPFVNAYLKALAEKLSKRFNKQIDPTKIIEDYIIRYNLTEKWTEWFHPWLMTDNDAVSIANKINPDIKSFKDLQKALNIARS